MTEPLGDLLPSPCILLGPGPSMADPRVLRAMATPLLGQFDPEFTVIMNEAMALCRFAFQTDNARTFPVSRPAVAVWRRPWPR
jgi:aspartate aminotransferase-like enzyme